MPYLWPAPPNWNDVYSLIYVYSTEIITNRDGGEQRIANRATPRLAVEFKVTAWDDQYRSIKMAFDSQQGQVINLHDATRSVPLAGIADDRLSFTYTGDAPTWIGAVVFVEGDLLEYHVTTPGAGAARNLDSALGAGFTANARVYQALQVRLAADVTPTRPVRGIIDGRVHFDEEVGTHTYAVTQPVKTWNGAEIWEAEQDWTNTQDIEFLRTVEQIDYGWGRVTTFLPTLFGTPIRTADYVFTNTDEYQALLDFFVRCAGRQVGFWLSTDEPDISASMIYRARGNAIISLNGLDVYNTYADNTAFRAISIKLKDPTAARVYAKISDIRSFGGRSDIRLTTLTGVTDDQIDYISWLPLVRLASDTAQFDFQTDSTGTVRFTYQTIRADDYG